MLSIISLGGGVTVSEDMLSARVKHQSNSWRRGPLLEFGHHDPGQPNNTSRDWLLMKLSNVITWSVIVSNPNSYSLIFYSAWLPLARLRLTSKVNWWSHPVPRFDMICGTWRTIGTAGAPETDRTFQQYHRCSTVCIMVHNTRAAIWGDRGDRWGCCQWSRWWRWQKWQWSRF